MIEKREDTNPSYGEKKYGDVQFADNINNKYPIDTIKHIKAAWSYIHMPRNAAQYDESDLKTIKDRIIKAWKEKIDPNGAPEINK